MALIKIHKRKLIKFLIIFPILYFIYFLLYVSTSATNYNEQENDSINHKRVVKNDDLIDANFINYESIKDNGKLGKALKIDDETLDASNKKLISEGWDKNAFNLYVSDLIPINRTLPDVRLPG